jgi:hypothetical protein
MPKDYPTDPRFKLHIPSDADGDRDPAIQAMQQWADQLPGVGKWKLLSDVATYNSPFTNYSSTDRPVRIRREYADIVRLDGVMKTTAAVNQNAPICTLPPQFRPLRQVQLGVGFGTGGGVFTGIAFEITTAGVLLFVEWTPAAPTTFAYFRLSFTYSLSSDKS